MLLHGACTRRAASNDGTAWTRAYRRVLARCFGLTSTAATMVAASASPQRCPLQHSRLPLSRWNSLSYQQTTNVPRRCFTTAAGARRSAQERYPRPAEETNLAAADAESTVTTATPICWRCQAPLVNSDAPTRVSQSLATAASASSAPIFCPACHTLQQHAIDDHRSFFDIFALPAAYDVSLSSLESSYKSLQKSLHPDHFHGVQHRAQHDIANTLSAYVNQAYHTLRQPYERALHLLALHGEDLSESSDTITDPELLMEIMDLRETLEETDDAPTLHRLAAENRATLGTLYGELARAFDARDMAAMRQLTIRLSYMQNLQAEIYKRMPVQ